jgi:hypothetical protein
MRHRVAIGVAFVAGGVATFLAQMFVGLNDASEYSNPWYLQAARWLAAALVVAGLAALTTALARGGRRRV